jgi:hypothetical protein
MLSVRITAAGCVVAIWMAMSSISVEDVAARTWNETPSVSDQQAAAIPVLVFSSKDPSVQIIGCFSWVLNWGVASKYRSMVSRYCS